MEIWKDVNDFEEIYQISNQGRVKSLRREIQRSNGSNYIKDESILTPFEDRNGYMIVKLSNKGKRKNYKIHRLVATAFIENPFNKKCVDHINTVKKDNRVENLRWVTYSENNNNPITRKKNSESNKNKVISDYSIEKRKITRGDKYKRGNFNKSKKVILINTGEVFDCILDASDKYNVNNGDIGKCCNGKREYAGRDKKTDDKLVWKFI